MKHSPSSKAADTIAIAKTIRRELEALTDDEEVIRDTLEGEVDLDGVLDHLLAVIANDEDMVVAIGERVAALKARSERLRVRIEARRALILRALEAAGWSSRERPLATVVRSRKAPAIAANLDEAQIPPRYWIESDPKLDRKAILSALVAGEEVPGAVLAPETFILVVR